MDCEAGGKKRTSAGLPNARPNAKDLQLVMCERNDVKSGGGTKSGSMKSEDIKSNTTRQQNGSPDNKQIILTNEHQEHGDGGPNTVSITVNSSGNNQPNNGLQEHPPNDAANEPPGSLCNNLDHNLARNVKSNLINRNQITRLSMARNLRHYLAVRLSCCLMIDQQLINISPFRLIERSHRAG